MLQSIINQYLLTLKESLIKNKHQIEFDYKRVD